MFDRGLGRGGWWLGAWSVCAGLAACTGPASTPAGQRAASLAPGVREVIQARCQAEVDELVAQGLVGASLGLCLPDESVVAVTAGWADADRGEALTPAHLLLSGSVGKTYVSGVVQHLLADGRLVLDEPLSAAFVDTSAPWWERVPNARQVTLRQLLQHTSGIPRYVFHPEFGPAICCDPERRWTPQECLAYLFDAPPLFAPGEGFAYADSNYLLVGLAIEEVTGRAFYDLAREWLLEPHGLVATLPTDRVDLPGVAQGHVVMGGGLGVAERTRRDGRFTYNVQFEWCGGGWASTPADLARWASILFGGRAAPGPYLDELLATVAAPELGEGLGYGLAVMRRDTPAGPWLGHDGFMPGYLSAMGYLPDSGLGLAIQVNHDDPERIGGRLSDRLVDLGRDVAALLPAD